MYKYNFYMGWDVKIIDFWFAFYGPGLDSSSIFR
jgi:hypothetical protein